MSATRDSNQNATFVFSNFYHLYQREKAKAGESSPLKGLVLASGNATALSQDDQESYLSWTKNEITTGKKNLSGHLMELRQARKKLSFMIQEMDDLLKRG